MQKSIILGALILIAAGGVYFFSKNQGEQVLPEDVKLYYYSPDLDRDEFGNILCSRQGLVFGQREVPKTTTLIQDTIKLLIKGELTQEEREAGVFTEFPLDGVSLEEVSLNGGILTLTFNDPNNKTSGGACRAGILWFQIEATAKQFAEVKEVKFLPEELFQP